MPKKFVATVWWQEGIDGIRLFEKLLLTEKFNIPPKSVSHDKQFCQHNIVYTFL